MATVQNKLTCTSEVLHHAREGSLCRTGGVRPARTFAAVGGRELAVERAGGRMDEEVGAPRGACARLSGRLGPKLKEAAVEAKQVVRALLDQLPDDCSVSDVLYHLYVLQAVERGQADVAAGRTIPHEEVDAALRRKWLRGGDV